MGRPRIKNVTLKAGARVNREVAVWRAAVAGSTYTTRVSVGAAIRQVVL